MALQSHVPPVMVHGVGVSTVSAADLVGTSDNNRSMVVAMGKEGVDGEMKALVTEGAKMLSASVVVQNLRRDSGVPC